jgi:hypothetical protein
MSDDKIEIAKLSHVVRQELFTDLLRDQLRLSYYETMVLDLLERVRKIEAKDPPVKIQCPSTNGYHQCRLDVDHAGDHKGINGKEEWYAWERR